MIRSIKLVYPLTPTQNKWDSWNWARRRRFKKSMTMATIAQKQYLKVKANKIRIHITRYGHSLVDAFNVVSGCKGLIDSLVDSGFIPDDNPKHLETGNIKSKIDRRNQRTEIIIEVLS